eukprot:Phypoly_transcript_00740.p1 GENE.Phypoly_transcript_00740~~Phypoly_transcript_00740.p1  ORF type:complete len:1286 (+),score=182.23 Phypoly_transcript_00740:225-4082(+)
MHLECWDTFFLWPLIVYKGGGSGTTVHLLASMIIWYRSATRTSVKLFLIGFWITSSASKFFWHILGVIWYQNKNGSRYFHLLPCIFYREGSRANWFVIFPFLWIRGSTNSTTIFLFPVLWIKISDSRTTFFLIPFIFFAKRETGFRFFLVPIIWFSGYHSGYKFIIAPIFYVIKTSSLFRFIVFPIYWYGKSASVKTVWFVPVWFRRRDDTATLFVIPAFFYNRSSSYAFVWTLPFWIMRRFDQSYTYSIAYIIYHYKNTNSQASKFILFPILWIFKYSESGDWRFVFFPILWLRRAPSSSHTVVFPVVWIYRSSLSRTIVVFPVFYKFANVTIFVPVYFGKKNSSTDYWFLVLLFYFHKFANSVSWCFFPLVWAHKNRDSNLSRFIFLPVYYYVNSPDEKIVHFWPIFGKTTQGDNAKYYVAWPIAIFSFSADSKSGHVFPLFSYKKTAEFSYFFSLLVYRKKTETTHTLLVLPLYFFNSGPDYKLRIIVPALYYSRFKSGNLFKYAFLIYLKLVNATEHTTFVYFFPFYGKDSRGHSSVRHFLLYPLFARRVDKEAEVFILDILWPLFHYENTPTVKSVRVLLYWDRKSNWSEFRIFLPLYFSFTKKATREVSMELSQSGSLANVRDSESELGTPVGPHDDLPISEAGAGAVALGQLDKPPPKKETEILSKITVFFPFFFRRETGLVGFIFGSPCILFPPLFIKSWDKTTGDFTMRLFPFFSHQKQGTTDTKTVLILLIRIFKDIELGILRFNVFLFFYRRSKEFTSCFFFPLLYWYKNNTEQITRTALIWLHPEWCTLVSRVTAPDHTKTFFFPLFYRHNSLETGRVLNCLIWLHPKYVALIKYRRQDGHTKFFFFPLVHARFDGPVTTFSLIWFVLPKLAMYRVVRENGATTFRWFFPLFYYSNSPALSLLTFGWLFYPYAALFVRAQRLDAESTSTWFFPVFYRKTSPGNTITSLFFLFYPRCTLYFRHMKGENAGITYFLFLYWHRFSEATSDWGFIWLFHVRVSIIFFHKNYEKNNLKIWFWPLFWFQRKQEARSYCLVYLYPPSISFISSMGPGNFKIWLIYSARQVAGDTVYALLYLFHPKACFIQITSGSTNSGMWMLLVFYWMRDFSEDCTYFSLIWLAPRKGYAFVTWNYFPKGDMAGHIFLVYWKCVEDGYLSFGFFWLFIYKLSLMAYYNTSDYVLHYFLLLYSYKENTEAWSLSILMWIIYITNSADLFQFRVIYRFFRIAVGRKRIVELQPLFHYKSKENEMQFIMFGCFGFGYKPKRGNYCRVTCCTC